MSINVSASGPLTWIVRSTATSQIVTSFSRAQYSTTGSS